MSGGKIGIIMLDTRFPRFRGDIGNPDSFSCPVLYRRVPDASAEQAVRGESGVLLAPFIAAGLSLAEQGADVIGTSCGFLSLFQAGLEEALPVPVVASALPMAAAPAVPAGILTIDSNALSARHLTAAGITHPVPVVGMPEGGILQTAIFSDRPELDADRACAEVVAAAKKLVAAYPDVRKIVFECTNLGPYARAVADATSLPVYSAVDALERRLAEIKNNEP